MHEIAVPIHTKIYTIRSMQVMIDRDLAELYEVETRVINQAVKRNIERFDDDFMFQLTKEELEDWKSQIVISNSTKMGLRKLPLAFTEQGVYMLATVLKSKVAIDVTKQIMRTFTQMRSLLYSNPSLFDRFERIEKRLYIHDDKIGKIFNLIESKDIKPTQGIFYNGQIWDAYEFINTLLKSAKQDVTLIDNYIDDSVLTIFRKYPHLHFTIITRNITKKLKLDTDKYNAQYNNLKIEISGKYHDRFLIIDHDEVYHIGASLKDLGKKIFAFSRINAGLLSLQHIN